MFDDKVWKFNKTSRLKLLVVKKPPEIRSIKLSWKFRTDYPTKKTWKLTFLISRIFRMDIFRVDISILELKSLKIWIRDFNILLYVIHLKKRYIGKLYGYTAEQKTQKNKIQSFFSHYRKTSQLSGGIKKLLRT